MAVGFPQPSMEEKPFPKLPLAIQTSCRISMTRWRSCSRGLTCHIHPTETGCSHSRTALSSEVNNLDVEKQTLKDVPPQPRLCGVIRPQGQEEVHPAHGEGGSDAASPIDQVRKVFQRRGYGTTRCVGCVC